MTPKEQRAYELRFAFAAKKKTGESYAFFTLSDGSSVVIEFPKTSYLQLKAIFAPYISKVSAQASEEKPRLPESGND